MRSLGPFVLVAALVAAPAAGAEPICDALKHAAKVGGYSNQFPAFRRNVPAPEGFVCRINVAGNLGAYACSTPVEPEARVARAKALIEAIRACFSASPIVETNLERTNAVFQIARSPKSWVIVNGADDATRLYVNVVVARLGPPSGQVPGPEAEPWGTAPYDPGREVRSPPAAP